MTSATSPQTRWTGSRLSPIASIPSAACHHRLAGVDWHCLWYDDPIRGAQSQSRVSNNEIHPILVDLEDAAVTEKGNG